MYKKISLLLFLSTSLLIAADHHGVKGDKSIKEMKKMEMVKKKEHMKQEMKRKGMWKPEDCKKVSEASGAYLYFSGQVLKNVPLLKKMAIKLLLMKRSQKQRYWQNLLQIMQRILRHIAKDN